MRFCYQNTLVYRVRQGSSIRQATQWKMSSLGLGKCLLLPTKAPHIHAIASQSLYNALITKESVSLEERCLSFLMHYTPAMATDYSIRKSPNFSSQSPLSSIPTWINDLWQLQTPLSTSLEEELADDSNRL